MSDVSVQDARQVAIDAAERLAQELRGRLADLALGVWDGPPNEAGVLVLALQAMEVLRAAVPELAGVRHWTDAEAYGVDPAVRVDRRARAAVRSLTVLARRAQGLPVAVSRR